MALVIVDNLQSKRIISKDKSEKLLDTLLGETDWMHACGAKGRCTTCKAIVVEGEANLSEFSEAEIRYKKMNKLKQNERLTCQVFVTGDIKIVVPSEYQLPHLTYSNECL